MGDINKIMPSRKSIRALNLATRPGMNSARWVKATMLFRGAELPKMKIVT